MPSKTESQNRVLRFKPLTMMIAVAMACLLPACGGLGSDDTDARVRSLTIARTTIAVGERRGIDLDFQFSRDDIFDDGDDLLISVVLPPSVEFIEDSGRIDGLIDDEDVDPVVALCEDGRSLLFFDLDDDELRGAEDPGGKSDARLEFDIIGVSPSAGANIEARADYNRSVLGCDSMVVPQESLLIAVE